jgi:hypothetical protein
MLITPKMSPRHSTFEPRLNAATAWLTQAIALLNDLHDGFGTPFLQTISGTSLSLINVVQVRRSVQRTYQFDTDDRL